MAAKKIPHAERSFRGLTPEERRRERYDKLVRAGTLEFGERGFRRTTVRDVCKAAGLTERYFYESFANLPALFGVVHERANELLRQQTLVALAGAPREPIALAEAALRVYLQFLADDPARAKILLVEAVSGDREVLGDAHERRQVFTALLRGFAQFLFPWLASPSQQLRLDVVCNGLIGSTNYIAFDWVREDFATPLENVLDSALTFYRGISLYAQSISPEQRRRQPTEKKKPARAKKKNKKR